MNLEGLCKAVRGLEFKFNWNDGQAVKDVFVAQAKPGVGMTLKGIDDDSEGGFVYCFDWMDGCWCGRDDPRARRTGVRRPPAVPG